MRRRHTHARAHGHQPLPRASVAGAVEFGSCRALQAPRASQTATDAHVPTSCLPCPAETVRNGRTCVPQARQEGVCMCMCCVAPSALAAHSPAVAGRRQALAWQLLRDGRPGDAVRCDVHYSELLRRSVGRIAPHMRVLCAWRRGVALEEQFPGRLASIAATVLPSRARDASPRLRQRDQMPAHATRQKVYHDIWASRWNSNQGEIPL